MESTWLLANCHKEEATVRVLEENMAREVEAPELLGKESRAQVRPDFSFDSVTPHRSRREPTTAKAEKVEWLCQSSAGPVTRWEVWLLSIEPHFQANGGEAEAAKTYRRENLWVQTKRRPRKDGAQGPTEWPEGSLPP